MKPKKTRLQIDVNEDFDKSLDQLCEAAGLSRTQVMKDAFKFLRNYVIKQNQGLVLRYYNPNDPSNQIEIEMPSYQGLKLK